MPLLDPIRHMERAHEKGDAPSWRKLEPSPASKSHRGPDSPPTPGSKPGTPGSKPKGGKIQKSKGGKGAAVPGGKKGDGGKRSPSVSRSKTNKAKDRGASPARGKSRDKASAPPAGETPQRGQEAPSEGDTAAVEVAAPVGKKGDGVKVSPSSSSGKGVLSKPALKGDASHAKPANKFRDDDAAATAIQSQMRGRQTRAAVAEKTCSPLAASTPALIVFSSHCAPTRTA